LADRIREERGMAETGLELLGRGLAGIYSAERRQIDLLMSLSDEVSDQELSRVFSRHKSITGEQIRRLENIFERARIERADGPCEGFDGLVAEYENFARKEKSTDKILDVFTNSIGIKIEYYEIISYKELVKLANNCSMNWAAMLLHDTLQEERQAADELERISHTIGQRITV
jgi:ferritin-like metal-binding protein YciE